MNRITGRLRLNLLFFLENFIGTYAETDGGHQPGTGGKAAQQGAFVLFFMGGTRTHYLT